MRRLMLLSVLFSLFAASAYAKNPNQEPPNNFEDDEDKPWEEVQATLPAFPSDQDWAKFTVTSATSNKFYIDVAHLDAGTDGVIRYTMKVESDAGAINITREGIRCASKEVKTYAFGDAKTHAWREPRDKQWREIRKWNVNRQHNVLYDDFFCPDGLPVLKIEQSIQALKHDRSLRPTADRN